MKARQIEEEAVHAKTSMHGRRNLLKTKLPERPKKRIHRARGWRMAVILNGTVISSHR